MFLMPVANAGMKEDIKNECKELGFKDGTPEIAKCQLDLLVLQKQMNLENKKLQSSQAAVAAAQASAAAAQATARASEMSARASQSIANSQAWRNNEQMKSQGMGMIVGKCNFGYNC